MVMITSCYPGIWRPSLVASGMGYLPFGPFVDGVVLKAVSTLLLIFLEPREANRPNKLWW